MQDMQQGKDVSSARTPTQPVVSCCTYVLGVVVDLLQVGLQIDLVGAEEPCPLDHFPDDDDRQNDKDHAICRKKKSQRKASSQ